MILNNYYRLVLLFLASLLSSCGYNDCWVDIKATPISPVSLDLSCVPYQTLSKYNFFDGNMSDLIPVYGVLPYKIISPFFIDYAKAKTFVWMPKGSKASYINDYSVLDFPNGAVLITTHYFENVLPQNNSKMIETRLLIKKEREWILANYAWDEDQTEALYTTEGSYVDIEWLQNNVVNTVNYRIPSYSECFTCHNKYDVIIPIGPKPQNINHSISYCNGVKNQLDKWAEFGYLDNNYPKNIVSTVNWEDTTQPINLRVRSYFDINCAHCHSDQGYCEYASMRFEFNQSSDIDNLGVCVESGFYINSGISQVVHPGDTDKSALFFRINSIEEQYKMPILGRTMRHNEGIQLIEEWINSLNSCE
jgi:uncharacterized repeat protein (TIGR03806 family)